jgi:hypothetical protein
MRCFMVILFRSFSGSGKGESFRVISEVDRNCQLEAKSIQKDPKDPKDMDTKSRAVAARETSERREKQRRAAALFTMAK